MARIRFRTPRQLAEPIQRFDDAIERAFVPLRGKPLLDRAFYTASELGDHSLIWHLLATTQGLRRGGDVAGTVRVVSLMAVESAVVNGVIKSMFRRQRPVHDGPRPHRLRTPLSSSFPSGHSSAGAAIGVALGAALRWWWPAGQALPRGIPRP